MNWKKGAAGYKFGIILIVLGLLITFVQHVVVPQLPDKWYIQTYQHDWMGAKAMVPAGVVILLLTFLGSFFNFATEDQIQKVIYAGVLVLVAFGVGLFCKIFFQWQPWMNAVSVGIITLLALLFATAVFLYAALRPDEEIDILKALIKSGKVVVFRPRNERNH